MFLLQFSMHCRQRMLPQKSCQGQTLDWWLTEGNDWGKHQLNPRHKRSPNDPNIALHKSHINRLYCLIKWVKKRCATSPLADCKSNKDQWKVITNLIQPGGNKRSIIETTEVNYAELTNPVNIANSFNQIFVSIGPIMAEKLSTNQNSISSSIISEPNFSFFLDPADPEQIANIIQRLKNTAAGMDHIIIIIWSIYIIYIL